VRLQLEHRPGESLGGRLLTLHLPRDVEVLAVGDGDCRCHVRVGGMVYLEVVDVALPVLTLESMNRYEKVGALISPARSFPRLDRSVESVALELHVSERRLAYGAALDHLAAGGDPAMHAREHLQEKAKLVPHLDRCRRSALDNRRAQREEALQCDRYAAQELILVRTDGENESMGVWSIRLAMDMSPGAVDTKDPGKALVERQRCRDSWTVFPGEVDATVFQLIARPRGGPAANSPPRSAARSFRTYVGWQPSLSATSLDVRSSASAVASRDSSTVLPRGRITPDTCRFSTSATSMLFAEMPPRGLGITR
jgi:hypothetical protein